jgi:hypothetical protein
VCRPDRKGIEFDHPSALFNNSVCRPVPVFLLVSFERLEAVDVELFVRFGVECDVGVCDRAICARFLGLSTLSSSTEDVAVREGT